MDHITAQRAFPGNHRPVAPLEPPAHDIHFTANDIRSILGVPLRHLKLVVLTPVVAIGLMYGVVKVLPPQYKSTIEILAVDTKQSTDPTNERRLSNFDLDQAAISSQIAVITSQTVTLRVAKELGLDKDPEFQRSPLAAIWESIGLSRLMETNIPVATSQEVSPDLERAAYELRENHLKVGRKEMSYVLEISATARHPAMAQQIATAVAQVYITVEIEARYEATRRAVRWLQNRVEEMRGRLLETEMAIEKLKAASGLSDTGAGSNVNLQQITDLNTQLSQARADAAEKQARYDQARQIVEGRGDMQSIPDVIASQLINQLRVQRTDLSRREVELKSRFGERHPEVTNIRSQIYDISNAINAEAARIIENMKNTLANAKLREQTVRTNLEKLTGQRADSNAVVKLAELKRVADADRKVYEALLATFNEVQQRTSIDQTGVRIINPAGLPNAPSFPRKTLMMVAAGVVAFGAAIALAFLLEYLDAGFRTTAQIERALGASAMGMIPKMESSKLQWEPKNFSALEEITNSPASRLSEAIRTLRTAMMLASLDRPQKVVLVTSSIPGEGKSTVSLLIATSSAASNKRTLLMDCDLRRGSITNLLGLGDKHGLAQYLSGKVKSAEDIIVENERLKLSVVPCGAETSNPTDLLSSDMMQQFLMQVRERYDLIVLDGAPILPVVDSVLLSGFVDSVLFVVEWTKTPRRCVFEAIKSLPDHARNVASIVLNKVDYKRLQSYGYGYGQGYNYGSYYRSMSKYYGKT
jgi:polysaccharide biosynthesis transport protein